MKIGLYAAMDSGKVRDKTIDYIAIDGGLSHLIKQGIRPILAIGDFDSLEDQHLLQELKVERYPVKKDDTDTALAISYAISHDYDEIDLYGVTNGRLDHFMAVICLLIRYHHYAIRIIDAQNEIIIINPGEHHIRIDHDYFSIFAYQDTDLSLSGCMYPLSHYLLKLGDPLCTSNVCTDVLTLINDQPVIFIQSNNQES